MHQTAQGDWKAFKKAKWRTTKGHQRHRRPLSECASTPETGIDESGAPKSTPSGARLVKAVNSNHISPMEYNFNQYPGFETTKSSLNHLVNSNLAPRFRSWLRNQDTVSSISPDLSHISMNSMTCGSRNIHVNKSLYYLNHDIDLNPRSIEYKKTECVHYNPKFLKNNTNVLSNQLSISQVKINKNIPKKQEPNIHVNPHFIKENNFNTVTQKKSSLLINPLYRSGIHFNPKFFKDQVNSKPIEIAKSLHNQTFQECHNSDLSDENWSLSRYISKYKIIRKKINASNISKCNLKKSNASLLRKYKSNREKLYQGAYSYLNKYSFKKYLNDRTPLNSDKKIKQRILNLPKPAIKLKEIHGSESKIIILNRKKSILQQKIEARRKGKSFAMYGFRNYLSNSMYNRNVPETCMKFSESSLKSHYSKHHYHKANIETSNDHVDKSVFKTISKTKLVRKSILQTQIESRRHARKSLLLQRASQKNGSHVSKYKIVNSLLLSKKNVSLKKVVTGMKKNPMTFSSKNYRADKLKRLHNLTKKLRKNNQPCSFYNRYGRCKGKEKGSCPKVHDPKYVSICKKFLKEECKEEGCTLSHDIRPEKMPTCYHYLAGLCKRSNCPYLHIKVNHKAPICRAFLLGFCADVYICNKRHEFICPVFVEKGYCLKGKSCSLPHRTPSIYSKLLEPDQFPLLNEKKQKKSHRSEVSIPDKHLEFKERVNNNSISSNKEVNIKTDGKVPSKQFQRYFLASLAANESFENGSETIITASYQSKDGE